MLGPKNVDARIETQHQRNCCGRLVIAVAQIMYRPLEPPDYALERVANELGLTALMAASIDGDVAMAHKLLQRGASVGLVNHYGRNALILAAMAGQHDVVRLLLSVDAPIDAVDAWDRDGQCSPAQCTQASNRFAMDHSIVGCPIGI